MTKPLKGSQGQAFEWKHYLRWGASIAAESNSRELLEIVHIIISDEGSDKEFSMVINKSS
jgi:hypothetical protein